MYPLTFEAGEQVVQQRGYSTQDGNGQAQQQPQMIEKQRMLLPRSTYSPPQSSVALTSQHMPANYYPSTSQLNQTLRHQAQYPTMSVQPSLANQMLMSLHHQQQMISQLQKQMNLFMQASTPPHGVNPVQFVNNGGQQQTTTTTVPDPDDAFHTSAGSDAKESINDDDAGSVHGVNWFELFRTIHGALLAALSAPRRMAGTRSKSLVLKRRELASPRQSARWPPTSAHNSHHRQQWHHQHKFDIYAQKEAQRHSSHPPGMSSTTSTVHQTASHFSMPTQMLTSGNSSAAVYKHTPSYHAPSSNSLPMAMLNDQDPLQQFMVDDYVNALANSGANALIGDGGYGPMMSFNPTDALERLLFD